MNRFAILMAMSAGVCLYAGEHVTVCVKPSATAQVDFASGFTSKVFAQVGVELEWHWRGKCPLAPHLIDVEFFDNASAARQPGALAYALPIEGTHIVIFYDRVAALARANRLSVNILLGYVMAHEIAHILQGICTHSKSGIMKAKWEYADTYLMQSGKLGFTASDIEMIRLGIACRNSREKAIGLTDDAKQRGPAGNSHRHGGAELERGALGLGTGA